MESTTAGKKTQRTERRLLQLLLPRHRQVRAALDPVERRVSKLGGVGLEGFGERLGAFLVGLELAVVVRLWGGEV